MEASKRSPPAQQRDRRCLGRGCVQRIALCRYAARPPAPRRLQLSEVSGRPLLNCQPFTLPSVVSWGGWPAGDTRCQAHGPLLPLPRRRLPLTACRRARVAAGQQPRSAAMQLTVTTESDSILTIDVGAAPAHRCSCARSPAPSLPGLASAAVAPSSSACLLLAWLLLWAYSQVSARASVQHRLWGPLVVAPTSTCCSWTQQTQWPRSRLCWRRRPGYPPRSSA